MVGLVLFTLASLSCGLAESDTWLIVARAVQGIGAAIVSPATLSIITDLFDEGAERNKALGIWGGIAAGGAAAGVLIGGILVDTLSWEWIFFVNIPVGAAAFALTPLLVPAGRRIARSVSDFDLAGAVTVTAGLMLLVFAIVKANEYGWASGRTIGEFIGAVVLLAVFLVIELRGSHPLMPLGFFRNRTPTGANLVGLAQGASIFGLFFLLTLYMQQVLEYSPLKTGVAYLATPLTVIVAAGIASQLVTRVGVKPVLAFGMVTAGVGLLSFTVIPVEGHYWSDLFPRFVLTGLGLGFSFVPVSIAALQGVPQAQAGLASGLLNTSQQIGGALGVAIITAVATAHTDDLLAVGDPRPHALTEGFQRGFLVGVVFAAVGVIVALLVIRAERAPAREPVPAET